MSGELARRVLDEGQIGTKQISSMQGNRPLGESTVGPKPYL